MRRIWKSIWRLPHIYLPLFFSAVLIVSLILLSSAVRLSCGEARELLDAQYHVSLTVSLKPIHEKVVGDDGKVQMVDRNTHLLDTSVLSILDRHEELREVHYPVNSFFIPLDMICTNLEYQSMQSHVNAKEGFSVAPRVYFAESREIYDVGICACTDQSMAAEALGVSAEELSVVYFGEYGFGDGVILPRSLYELYGALEKLVFGWYTEHASGLGLGDMLSGASVTDRISSIMQDMAQMPAPPTAVFDVIGVYDTGESIETLKILASPDVWNDIWRVYDYYQTRTECGWHALRPNANAWDDLGVRYITCTLHTPSKAAKVIGALMDAGLSADHFFIVASDYQYKFALSQIHHVTAVAEILHVCAVIFGSLCMLLLLRYAIRRRSGEILIRRTLGERGGCIAITLVAEIFTVLFLAWLSALALSLVAGDGLCTAVEQYMQSRAEAAVSHLSAITEFMKDGEHLKEQLLSAIEAYGNNTISLHYRISTGQLGWFALCVPCICGVSLLFALPALKGTLLKRGDV